MTRLVGMLDSPYVRRVAISLKAMGLPFEHQPLSVFRDFESFSQINPVVKAPTLITADGTVLLDSTLILDYLERLAPPDRRLTPEGPEDFAVSQRIIGLALAACEKTVQIVYEQNLRPAEKLHQPWIERVQGQLSAAYRLLEIEFGNVSRWRFGDQPSQADITAAVAWRFTRDVLPEYGDGSLVASEHPALVRLSGEAEALSIFMAVPPV